MECPFYKVLQREFQKILYAEFLVIKHIRQSDRFQLLSSKSELPPIIKQNKRFIYKVCRQMKIFRNNVVISDINLDSNL